jgi:cation transport ATPase
MDVQVNYLAVLLAGVSTMVVGSIWYAKPVFGETWRKLVGLDEKKMSENAVKALSLTFLASLVSAYVLAHVTYLSNSFFGNSFLQDALSTAFWLWLGFTAARILTHDLFENRPTKLTIMSLGNELVTIMVMGLVIGLLKP